VQPLPAASPDGGAEVVVTSLWESIPAWEGWNSTAAAAQQHLPTGVMQYVPAKGEGFPEAFVPFVQYDAAVNAKY
jgi:heme-degrading monooxygenase HmoA